MLIDGILADGLAVMAGDSKIGKSWMVLWLCLQISKGDPVWGIPTRKTDVVYLALEDREWRIQQRMQELTEAPPENLHFGFSCGQLGSELESQIEAVLQDYPSTGLIFIDTLQMIRDNVSGKVNAYAQDYRDLSSLKKIADNHGICICAPGTYQRALFGYAVCGLSAAVAGHCENAGEDHHLRLL